MPEGKPVIIIKRDVNGDFKGMFNRAMEELTSGTKALICIDGFVSDKREVVAEAITSCFEEERKPLIYLFMPEPEARGIKESIF